MPYANWAVNIGATVGTHHPNGKKLPSYFIWSASSSSTKAATLVPDIIVKNMLLLVIAVVAGSRDILILDGP